MYKLSKNTHNIGLLGEKIARSHIKDMGMIVLLSNYQESLIGEIDIICLDQNTLVFVEVKTRIGNYESLKSSIDKKKMRRIFSTANNYRAKLNISSFPYRFDVAEILLSSKKKLLMFNYWVNSFTKTDL